MDDVDVETSPQQLDRTKDASTNQQPSLNTTAESDHFVSADEVEMSIDNGTRFIDENHDPNITIDKRSTAKASISTLVQKVAGEQVKFTSKDMDIIRNCIYILYHNSRP